MHSLQTPRVSVIMPARNVDPFIDEALASVRASTMGDLEILVIDDGSTDHTADRVRRHAAADPRIRLLTGPGRGAGAARNLGFSHARGCWLAVVDADDAVHPDRLGQLVRQAEATGVQIVADNLTAFYDEGGADHIWLEGPEWQARRLITLTDLLSTGLGRGARRQLGYLKPLFRARWVFDRGLTYDETLPIGEDFDFVARSLAAGAAYAYQPTAGYRYRRRSTSISHRITPDQLRAMIVAAEGLERHLDGPERVAARRRIEEMELDRRFALLSAQIKTGTFAGLSGAMAVAGVRSRLKTAMGEAVARRLARLGRPARALQRSG